MIKWNSPGECDTTEALALLKFIDIRKSHTSVGWPTTATSELPIAAQVHLFSD
jgi:hypothetical protein